MWLFFLAISAASEPLWPDLSSPPQVGGGERDAALVVAVEDYLLVSDIAGARQNGEDWYRYLTRGRSISPGNIKLLVDRQATREEILQAAEQVADAVEPGGTLWFVFIGHGAPGRGGQDGLLLGSDVDQTAISVYARGVTQSALLDVLGSGKQAQTIALIDACFSGRGSDGSTLAEGLQPLVPSYSQTISDDVVVLSAGRSDEFAGPLPGAARPAFSYLALGALRGWGDADRNGQVTAREITDYSTDVLRGTMTGRRQTPQHSGQDTTVRSGRETGPDLAGIRLALSDRPATPTGGASVVGAGNATDALAALEAMAAEERALEARRAAAQAQLDAEIAEKKQALYDEVDQTWPRFRAIAEAGGETGQRALETFITTYGDTAVVVGDQRYPIEVPEVDQARTMLDRTDQTIGGTIGQGSIGGDPIILGALDKSLIDAVIKHHLHQIQSCYQTALTKYPSLAGKIVVKFVIASDGSVSKASTKSSTMNSPAVEGCINQRFMRFQFPEPRGGGIVIVSYPFVFSPG